MGGVRFSGKEIKHLIISVLVMGFLVAIYMSSRGGLNFSLFLNAIFLLPFAVLITAPAFVFHELGHKIVAQKFGFWAEYRMWTQGLLLAILITIITAGRFLFIAPGAVYFAAASMHRVSMDKVGKIGLIGPIINIFLSIIFGLFALSMQASILREVAIIGASVNAFLAIFNLIPFQPFDGQKVFVWDKKIWAITIVLAIVLYITSLSVTSG